MNKMITYCKYCGEMIQLENCYVNNEFYCGEFCNKECYNQFIYTVFSVEEGL